MGQKTSLVHGVDSEGRVAFKQRIVRTRLFEFLSSCRRVGWRLKPAAAPATGRAISSM
jgi:hypothetical protein